MPSRLSPERRKRLTPPRNLPVSIDDIFVGLMPLYGPVDWKPRYNALDELIFTVLTQHTSDLNAERAFDELRRRIPTWGEVIEAEAVAYDEGANVASGCQIVAVVEPATFDEEPASDFSPVSTVA